MKNELMFLSANILPEDFFGVSWTTILFILAIGLTGILYSWIRKKAEKEDD